MVYFVIAEDKREMSRLKLYSTPTCPWCAKIREFLKSNGIPFTDFDVTASQKAARELRDKSGQMAVPLILAGKEMIVGYDEDALKKLLKIK